MPLMSGAKVELVENKDEPTQVTEEKEKESPKQLSKEN